MLMLIHPTTGAVSTFQKGEPHAAELFIQLVLDGYRPVGPKAQALAEQIRAAHALKREVHYV